MVRFIDCVRFTGFFSRLWEKCTTTYSKKKGHFKFSTASLALSCSFYAAWYLKCIWPFFKPTVVVSFVTYNKHFDKRQFLWLIDSYFVLFNSFHATSLFLYLKDIWISFKIYIDIYIYIFIYMYILKDIYIYIYIYLKALKISKIWLAFSKVPLKRITHSIRELL